MWYFMQLALNCTDHLGGEGRRQKGGDGVLNFPSELVHGPGASYLPSTRAGVSACVRTSLCHCAFHAPGRACR